MTTMLFDISRALIILATVFNGIVAGESSDQSIKQLPSRHKMDPRLSQLTAKQQTLIMV